MVRIDYPDDVDLSSFVDYVSQTLDIKICYDNELNTQTVKFRPGQVEIPKNQLLDLLRSMLRMKDLAIIPGEIEGWLRIVKSGDMQRHVREVGDLLPPDSQSNEVVTQVIPILSEDISKVVEHGRSFLSSSKASVIPVPEKHIVIITDYASAIRRAVEVMELVDSAPIETELVTVPLQHLSAETVCSQVLNLLNDQAKLEGRQEPSIIMQPAPSSLSIVLVGEAKTIERARELISSFDRNIQEADERVAYSPRYMSAERLLRLLESTVAVTDSGPSNLRSYLEPETNRLYIIGPRSTHDEIERLLESEDLPTLEAACPVRIYHPKNRSAADLISVLSGILPNVTSEEWREVNARSSSSSTARAPGPNSPPNKPGASLPVPPAHNQGGQATATSERVHRVSGSNFELTCDEHTNTIIAVGPREFHRQLEQLMKQLDKRRAQVLIEMTLVAVTFNDSFSLGIELTNEETHGSVQSLLATSFGLSGIDIPSGVRTFSPGGGFNGLILGPHETPILFRAIAARGDSRVITTPKVVVAGNTTATISNVEEAPFTSVNASDTVATTSFAGFESAGTTLTVTPRATEGEHVVLDYSFNFSNFNGQGSTGVPPPRSTNSFAGNVEVPDGYTVIVGGLVTENETDAVTEVPLLGRIPAIGSLFQQADRTRTKSRVFAFIKTTVLRDDQFADLKYISTRELQQADLVNRDFPRSSYLWME